MKYASYLIIILTSICFAASAGAVTTKQVVGTPSARTQKARKAPERKSVKFVSWKGNRLSTTAGTFLIGRKVKVIDKAKSRQMKKGFSGPAPTVKLIFKDRRLVKVIIR